MKVILGKIELYFWDAVIPLLSESQLVRSSVREVHNFYVTRKNWYLLLILSWAGIALVAGFFLGRFKMLF